MKLKNKIFELYDRRSLVDFLDYKEAQPNDPLVYVLQHPPRNMNILGAAEFGNLVICLPELSQMIFSSTPFIFKMKIDPFKISYPKQRIVEIKEQLENRRRLRGVVVGLGHIETVRHAFGSLYPLFNIFFVECK